MSRFTELLSERILILDGGFGTAVLSKNTADEDFIPEGFYKCRCGYNRNQHL